VNVTVRFFVVAHPDLAWFRVLGGGAGAE